MNQHIPPPVPTVLAVELITCDGQRVMVPLYRLVEAHTRLNPRQRDTIDLIQEVCAEYFRLPAEALCGDRREAEIVYARHVAIYLSRKMTQISTLRIGRRFGDRDHSTVLFAVRKIETRIDIDLSMRADISHLKAAISEALAS